jgi:hypothetical protein
MFFLCNNIKNSKQYFQPFSVNFVQEFKGRKSAINDISNSFSLNLIAHQIGTEQGSGSLY